MKLPDEYVEVDPDQREEGAREVNLTLHVDRHVHPDQSLVGEKVRTLAAEPQRRVDLLQQSEHVHVVDLAPGNIIQFNTSYVKDKTTIQYKQKGI